MNPILEPVVSDAITCWSKWKNPSQADALRKLFPTLEAVCISAKVPAERATEWLQSQAPENITAESIREFVRSVTEAPADTLVAARARQAQIEREIASDKPLTARDHVLLERKQPLAERSRQSIEDEIFESHNCRTREGVELPDLSRAQWDALGPHYAALEQEITKRDCAVLGVPYITPVKRERDSLAYLSSMRG